MLTIKDKYRWVGKVYSDWFREPLSPLERIWRLPFLFKETQKFLKEKLYLAVPEDFYKIKGGYLFIRTDWLRLFFQPGTFLVPAKLVLDLFSEKKSWDKYIRPTHLRLLRTWRRENLEKKTNKELWEFANHVMQDDVYYTIRTVYLGLYSIGLELTLRWFYKFFVKDSPQGYEELLIGFPNETFRMNTELFKLARLKKNGKIFKRRLDKFIDDFGARKSDWELLHPTLGENENFVRQLIGMYEQNPELNPARRLQEARRKREKRTELAIRRLKVGFLTKPIFIWILKWAHEYVPMRETRQRYAAAGTLFIRRSLNLLGKRIGFKENTIFYLERSELEQVIKGGLLVEEAHALIEKRCRQRERQKLNLPNHE